MAKLVFIPDWLKSELAGLDVSVSVLDKDLASTIESSTDVINYHKTQIEFLNFLAGGLKNEEEAYLMYNSLFAHPLPDMPELKVYLRQAINGVTNPGMLAAGVNDIAQIDFIVDSQSEGKSIYIIGASASQITEGGVDKRHTVITDMLAVMHNRLRIQNGAVDKSSVFRDAPLLTTLYVDSIPCYL